MIGPVAQSWVLPSDMRGAAESGGGPDDDALFARLLGMADGDMPSPLGEEGFVATEMPAPQVVLDGPSDPDRPDPAPLAHIFNQDGFFGHAFATPGLGQPAAVQLDAVADAFAGIGAREAADPAGRGARALSALERAHGSTIAEDIAPASPALRGATGAKGAAPAAVQARAPVAAGPPASEGGESDAPEVPLPRRALRAVLAAQSPVHVAVGEVEQGLRVTAHVAGLDETERRQLREAISALLARHGLGNARIQIHAMSVRGNER